MSSLGLKVEFEGENRRMRIQGKDGAFAFQEVHDAVDGVFGPVLGGAGFTLYYTDEDGDEIMVGSDAEVSEAVACSGGKQLKLRARSDKKAGSEEEDETKDETEDQTKDEDKDEAKDESKGEEEEESSPEEKRVPLSEVLGEEITSNPYFIAMQHDFGTFVQNVRGSVPSDFPENVRSDLEGVMDQVREPIQEFMKGLQETKEEMTVPASWKENPLIVRVSNSMKDCREGFEARTQRWAEAKDQLEAMGIETSPFVQRVLIVVHDGDLELVLNDLFNKQQRAVQIRSTFQWLSVSLVQLFRDFGVSASRHSCAIANQVSDGVQSSASFVQDSVQSSASFVQGQVMENRLAVVESLQKEFDHNVKNLQATITQLNKMGEQADENFHKGWSNAVDHSANLYQAAHRHGFDFSATTLGILSNSVHGLNSLVLQLSQGVHRSEDDVPLFTCDVCQMEVHKGSRFVCAECESFSTCEACVSKDSLPHNPEHVLLKVSFPRQKVHPQRYLTGDFIKMLNQPRVMVESEEVKEEEVKEEEVKEEEDVKEEVKEEVEVIQMDEIVDPKLESSLETLREMGFCDDEKNTILLLAHSYDLGAVIDALQ